MGLKVGVSVHPEEIAGTGDGVIAAVDPGGPGVDVADWGADFGGGEGPADLADVVHDVGGRGADAGVVGDAGGRDAVEVLAADGDAGDEGGEGRAVLGDGGIERGDFGTDGRLAGGGPEAEEERRLGGDGGGDGGGGAVGRAALDHGVEARAGEGAGGPCEVRGCGEFVLEGCLVFDRAI